MIARKIEKIKKKTMRAHKLIDDIVCDLFDMEFVNPASLTKLEKKIAKKRARKRSKK